jgi:hypothetical protein
MQRQTDMAKLTDKFLQLSVMNMHKNTTTGIQNTNNLLTWSTGSKIETEEGTGACTSPHAMRAHIPTHTQEHVYMNARVHVRTHPQKEHGNLISLTLFLKLSRLINNRPICLKHVTKLYKEIT